MFIPSMAFALVCDAEILYQTRIYEPISFRYEIPYSRFAMALVGFSGAIVTLLLLLFSFLAFTPALTEQQFYQIFLTFLLIKLLLWSPFIGLEYYDTFFENIYFDVQF